MVWVHKEFNMGYEFRNIDRVLEKTITEYLV